MLRPTVSRQQRIETLENLVDMPYEDIVADLACMAPHTTLSSGASAFQAAWAMGKSGLRLPSVAVFDGKVQTHEENGRPTIMALPDEVLIQVLGKIPYRALVRALTTCRRFYKQWLTEALHRRWFEDRLVVRATGETRGVDAHQMWPGLLDGPHPRPWFEATMRAEAWRRVCHHYKLPPIPQPDWTPARGLMRMRKVKHKPPGLLCTFCRQRTLPQDGDCLLMSWALCCVKCWKRGGFHLRVGLAQNIYGIGCRDDHSLLKGRRFHDPFEPSEGTRTTRILTEDVEAQAVEKFNGDMMAALNEASRLATRRLTDRLKRPRDVFTLQMNAKDLGVLAVIKDKVAKRRRTK